MSRQEEDSTFGENRFGINEELWNIIVRATMLKSSDRYQDIFKLRKDLNLNTAFFCETNVTDITPLKDCTKLTMIGFNECPIGDSFSVVKNMSGLTMACLHNCGISDISPLANKPNLSYIYLGCNWISDPSPLWDCVSITDLYLDHNSITADSILDFMGLTIDGTLDVSGNNLTEEQADEICGLLDGDLKSIVF